MSTRPLECGTCGMDHPSSEECPKLIQLDPPPPRKRKLLIIDVETKP